MDVKSIAEIGGYKQSGVKVSSGIVFSGVSFSFRKLHGGPFWTVPELLFNSKKLIPAIQQLLFF